MRERSGAGEGSRKALILVVDDNPANLEIVGTYLERRGYDVARTEQGQTVVGLVESIRPDLVLLDVMMPDMDGYEVARRLRSHDGLAYVPIIFVTARDTTRDKVAGLDAGADDYLTKPVNFPELEARVRSVLRIKRLQDQLEEKNRQLAERSNRDGLTGLFNHRRLFELLAEEFERSRRSREPVSVVMFDLDHFKQVNDGYGHQAGDRVLQTLAAILRDSGREIDRLGRYGGEEFLAILPGADSAAARAFAERVRKRVAGHRFLVGANGPLALTVSAGVATHPHTSVKSPLRLVRYADQALYSAKHSGRNVVVSFDPDTADD